MQSQNREGQERESRAETERGRDMGGNRAVYMMDEKEERVEK